MTAETDPETVVRQALDAVARRDLEALLGYFDVGALFEPLSVLVYREPGTAAGHTGLRLYFQDLWRTWGIFDIEALGYHAEGDNVVVQARIHAVARGGGFTRTNEVGLAWRVKDGRIQWGKTYENPQQALDWLHSQAPDPS